MAININPASEYSEEYLKENNSAPLIRLCIAFLVLETFFMILLYISRWMSKTERATWYMIGLMTAGYTVAVTKLSTAILMVHMGGTGRHLKALSWPEIQSALKFSLVMQIVCPLTTSLTKLGILCLFDQIIGKVSKRARWVIRATFCLTVVLIIIQIVIPLANCNPLSRWWNPTGPGSCAFNGLSLWRYLGIPNMFITFIMICIPIPTLWKLNTTISTKAGLGVILTVCLAGVVIAMMRVKAFLDVQNFDDITFENVRPMCFTVAESGIYLIAGVMMTLRPLMLKVLQDVPLDRILTATFRSTGRWGSHMEIKEIREEKSLLKERRWYKTGPTGTVVAVEDEQASFINDHRR